jgi:hypothetical protein
MLDGIVPAVPSSATPVSIGAALAIVGLGDAGSWVGSACAVVGSVGTAIVAFAVSAIGGSCQKLGILKPDISQ